MAAKKSSNTLSGWVNSTVPGEPLDYDRLPEEPAPPQVSKNTVSPLRELLRRHGIDADPFIEWFAPLLGRYRDEVLRVRKEMPTQADERDFLRDLQRRSDELHALVNDLPPRTGAALHRVHGHGLDLKRLSDDLLSLARLCREGEAALGASPARRGRKRANPRKDLLAATVEQLQAANLGKAKTRELAAEILALCGIDTPEDERAIRRAVGGT